MRKIKPLKRDFKKTLGFLIGCALILASPHSMYISMLVLHSSTLTMQRVVSIISLLSYPVPVLIGLYALFLGLVLVWKCQGTIKNLDRIS